MTARYEPISPALTPWLASQAGMAIDNRPWGMPWAKYMIAPVAKRARGLLARMNEAPIVVFLRIIILPIPDGNGFWRRGHSGR